MKILGLSGKKQSGKTTTANWIVGQQLIASGAVDWIRINKLGRLVVPAEVDGEIRNGIFDPMTTNPQAQELLAYYVWPVVKLFSFATVLKLSTAAIFGLIQEQVDGTDAQKNELTKFKWEQFRFIIEGTDTEKAVHEDGGWNARMSSRRLLQVVGTDIFRRVYGDVWVDACLNDVNNSNTELAIITDCRFPNEVEGIQKAGGKVVRFLRAPFAGKDEHFSETALDDYPLDGFDHVFDNREMSIEQQNKQTETLLDDWGWNPWKWELAE